MHSLACSFWPHVLQNPRLLPSKRVEEINIACSLKQFKFVWLLRGWARCCDFLMSHIHHIRQENSLHCNKFDETLLFRFLHWEKNKDVYSQLSCKAIYSSYQCNSHRDAVSLFMQLSTIKRNIISMLFFLLLSTSQSSYRHNTWKVIFLPRAYRRNRCVIPPADSPSHHQLTYTGSGIISHWSLLHLINSHLQTAVSDMRVHFWV